MAPLTGRPARQDVEEKTGRASNAYKEDFGAHLRGKRLVHNVLSEGVQADGRRTFRHILAGCTGSQKKAIAASCCSVRGLIPAPNSTTTG